MVVRWSFHDPTIPETYVLEINPNEGGSPEYKKTITYANTSAPDGKTLIFEGRDEVQTISFSGTLLTVTHLTALTNWFQKRHQILVTDDLSRQFWIYITSFSPKRERAAHSPYKHSYTVEATVLDWPT